MLERYFPDFLELLFPTIHCEIDWDQPFEFLNQELQQVVRDAEIGRRYADKLVKVFTYEGRETWVLIHIEVQGQPDADFARRMFVYFYRLFDRYDVDVVSIAVLTDDTKKFAPTGYRRERFGCRTEFHFPTQKLLEWESRIEELEASRNPFSLVVLAHLAAKNTRDGGERREWKLRLVRLMYNRGYAKTDILELFRVIDWIVRLPAILEQEFMRSLEKFEQEQAMPYITSVERMGIEKGIEQGIEQGMKQGIEQGLRQGEATLLLRQITAKFGPPTKDVIDQVKEADAETLLIWSERILSAQTTDELFGPNTNTRS